MITHSGEYLWGGGVGSMLSEISGLPLFFALQRGNRALMRQSKRILLNGAGPDHSITLLLGDVAVASEAWGALPRGQEALEGLFLRR